MKREMLIGVISLLMLAAVLAAEPQAPAAQGAGTPATRVAVVDFQKAVVDNSEGKKAQEKFTAELNKREKEFQDKQKTLADTQTKLQNGDKTLSDNTKADMAKQIDRLNTPVNASRNIPTFFAPPSASVLASLPLTVGQLRPSAAAGNLSSAGIFMMRRCHERRRSAGSNSAGLAAS